MVDTTETCTVHPSVTLVEDTSDDVPRAYCPQCESGERRDSKRQAVPSGTVPPDFEDQRDADSASRERAAADGLSSYSGVNPVIGTASS